MKRYLIYLIGLLFCGLLIGCTAGPVEEMPETAQLVAISFGKPDLGIPVVLTRADETVTPAPEPAFLPAGATVRICGYLRGEAGTSTTPVSFATAAPSFEVTYVVEADGSLSPCVVDDTGTELPGNAGELIVRGGVYDFYAVSPARKPVKDADNRYMITALPHKEDIMTSFAREVTISRTSRVVELATFRRQCALLVFNVAPSPGNALSFEQLFGTQLVLSNISSTGAALIAGADTGISPTGGESGAETEVLFGSDEFVPVEEGSDPKNMKLNKAKGVILPKNDLPFEVEISVQRDNETATLKATVDKRITFDAGKRYVFTLEVRNDESRLNLRVLAWNAVPFSDGNVGGPDKPYPDPDIHQGIGVVMTVASWKNIIWSGNGEVGNGE